MSLFDNFSSDRINLFDPNISSCSEITTFNRSKISQPSAFLLNDTLSPKMDVFEDSLFTYVNKQQPRKLNQTGPMRQNNENYIKENLSATKGNKVNKTEYFSTEKPQEEPLKIYNQETKGGLNEFHRQLAEIGKNYGYNDLRSLTTGTENQSQNEVHKSKWEKVPIYSKQEKENERTIYEKSEPVTKPYTFESVKKEEGMKNIYVNYQQDNSEHKKVQSLQTPVLLFFIPFNHCLRRS